MKRENAIRWGLVGTVIFGVLAFVCWYDHYTACRDTAGNLYAPQSNGICPLFSGAGVLFPVDVFPIRIFGVIFGLIALASLVYAGVGGREPTYVQIIQPVNQSATGKFCGQCGTRNPLSSNYCNSCGQKLQ